MQWLLLALVRCYPPGFRREHGEEMRQFVRTSELSRSLDLPPKGGSHNVAVTMAIAVDLLSGAAREWFAVVFRGSSGPRTADRGQRPGEPMRNVLRDVTHAARTLSKSPGFTIAAVATLALGVGANTAMFTLADATLLRPLQIREPERLVVWSWSSSYPDYQEYTKRTDVFEGVAAVAGGGRLNFVVDGRLNLSRGLSSAATRSISSRVAAAHGRVLLPADDVPNGPLVAVLGYDYWRTRFGGDPAVVGRTFRANGRPVTIVGVLQKGFRGVRSDRTRRCTFRSRFPVRSVRDFLRAPMH